MDGQPVSNDIALRIGLAARRLSVSARELIDLLRGAVGDLLDEDALQKVTVAHLRAGIGQTFDVDGDEDGERETVDTNRLKEVVRILWGVPDGDEADPVAEEATPLAASIRVAVASNTGENLDGHFGSCLQYLVYQVSPDTLRLIDVRSTAEADSSDDRNRFRVNLIRDCRVLYVVSIGGPASAKVIRADIHIVPTPDGGPAREVLRSLQDVMSRTPPPWLKKAMSAA